MMKALLFLQFLALGCGFIVAQPINEYRLEKRVEQLEQHYKELSKGSASSDEGKDL